MTDLTKAKTENASRTIEAHYDELMSERDPEKLANDVVQLVTAHGGISPNNLAKFRRNVANTKSSLQRLQAYVTNFLLAGSGLAVAK